MEAIQALWSACCERQRDRGHDRTHLVGRAAEDFVMHLVCPACGGFHWKSYVGNHPAYDLTCEACVPPLHFQIKAGKGLARLFQLGMGTRKGGLARVARSLLRRVTRPGSAASRSVPSPAS